MLIGFPLRIPRHLTFFFAINHFGSSIGHIFITINFMYLRQLRVMGLKPRSNSGFIGKGNELSKITKKLEIHIDTSFEILTASTVTNFMND